MPGVQGQCLSVDGVFGAADGPAAGEFLDLAAKGLCNDLVAKADADQRAACLADGADQLFQRGDPVVILVGTVFRSGDQPPVRIHRRGGEVAIDHGPDLEVEPVPAQQFDEHVAIIAKRVFHIVGGVAGLKDTDFHGGHLITPCPDRFRPALAGSVPAYNAALAVW